MTACEIFAAGNTGETFRNTMLKNEPTSTTNLAERMAKDMEELEDQFEPDDTSKLPHYYSFTDEEADKLIKAAQDKSCGYYLGVVETLAALMGKHYE
jgi:gas vesicle protein